MKSTRDLLWLVGVLIAVALAVAWTPYQIPVPFRSATPSPSPGSAVTPEAFTFSCSGSRHAKAYTGFPTPIPPHYFVEAGLMDHP